MPDIVTHFTNNLRCVDKAKQRLKPKAFIHPDTSEISVVDIDEELKFPDSDIKIFSIGDLIYTGESKVKARGDMKVVDIEKITYGDDGNNKIYLEFSPTEVIPKHYNIKPEVSDLEFANNCSHNLSRISKLIVK